MFKNKLLKRRGQSTLEYIVLVTAIIVVLLIFLNPSTGRFSTYLNRALDSAGQGMNLMSCRVFAK
ncbi:MAG TPA: class III signal peptide-containing protein [Candidatus Omnitrophota bacterium]|jgi:uncharacterized protein (UPF0333 family)|nr:class III signal peptide-containing protein [Candidatus Omnitrophota bacterium]HSA30210.1 class III signal peptide-containing protein [Candidatus Omnitrophota bacterium]